MKYKKNELEVKELESRMRFEQLISDTDVTVVKWTADRYSFIDACVVSANTINCYVELKERYCNSNTYDSILIEAHKVDTMLTRTKDKDVIPLLMCMYQDNVILVINLKTARPQNKILNKMQKDNYTVGEVKYKLSYLYSVSDAFSISYKR